MKYINDICKSIFVRKKNDSKLKYFLVLILSMLFIFSYIDIFTSLSFAQESRFKRNNDRNRDRDRAKARSSFYDDNNKKEEEEDKPKNENVLDDGWSDLKKFSDSEKKQICKKYEGKYISYYDNVFLVKKCKRQIQNNPEVSSKKLIPVDSDVIAQIPPDLNQTITSNSKKLNCKDLNHKYVTESYIYVYYVENCTLHQFPDWVSYQIHSKSKGKEKEKLIEIKKNLYPDLVEGEPFISVVNQEKMVVKRIQNESLDIISLNDACHGLNGKFVSYVDKIYKIENCRKREIDPKTFMQKYKNTSLKELSSNQWLSIPNGKPIN